MSRPFYSVTAVTASLADGDPGSFKTGLWSEFPADAVHVLIQSLLIVAGPEELRPECHLARDDVQAIDPTHGRFVPAMPPRCCARANHYGMRRCPRRSKHRKSCPPGSRLARAGPAHGRLAHRLYRMDSREKDLNVFLRRRSTETLRDRMVVSMTQESRTPATPT